MATKKTKTPTVKTATQQDAAFITTTAREFALSYPDELSDIIKRIQEWLTHPTSEKGLTPLEVIVRKFEEEARAILKKQGYANTIDKLLNLEEANIIYSKTGGILYVNLDITVLNAKQVLLSAKALREAIKKKQAEQAALEMLKLFSAAICADLHDTIMQGWRTQRGQQKKKPPRAALAIKDAMKILLPEKLKKDPKYKPKMLWHYFENNHKGKDKARIVKVVTTNKGKVISKDYKVFFYADFIYQYREDEHDPKKDEIYPVTFETFRQYFREIKESC